LSNRLLELDAFEGKLLRTWDVGVAPYDVVIVGGKAFVSNWGGRRPGPDDLTGPAGRGMRVRVDPVRHIASEGSVSILDLDRSGPPREVLTGLHACALAVSPDQRYVVVANAGSDTLSVLDAQKEKIVETIWTRQSPADSFGASPNALVFDPQGHNLYVCNGTQNAIAVVRFKPGRSELQGLIPVGWFPGAIAFDAPRQALCVANIKGIGSGSRILPREPVKFNSHQHQGSISIVPIPTRRQLKEHTRVALRNMQYPRLKAATLKPRPGQPPRPVPERVGEPSVFKHVVYIIKENRTYDQVFGDIAAGNGDPSLCIFGERFTPNQHKMVREFTLLDNTYCSGVLSADGHEWSTTAFATDYMEKSFAGFPRSYPDGMEDDDTDALAYSPGGFIWDNVLRHGKTLRDYGEFGITDKRWKDPARKAEITFLDHWRDWTNGTYQIHISSRPAVESLRPHLATNTVGWDMDIPDVFRAAQFIGELREYERKGEFPNLVIICLPNDHTSGTKAGAPTPAAQVADNDLAFGQIVEAISHSRFWKETCILAIEDDPQAGWDHVSGYRTTAYVVSPYTKRGQVVSTQYNSTGLIRTMELILGLPPMNQFDATATPMTDCFTAVPDFTPFVAVSNTIPLDQMNPDPKSIKQALLRRNAQQSAKLDLDRPDACPEDALNRILWHAMKGAEAPYPEWAITRVEDDD
jgi:YVTN family beta-propeller protein